MEFIDWESMYVRGAEFRRQGSSASKGLSVTYGSAPGASELPCFEEVIYIRRRRKAMLIYFFSWQKDLGLGAH